MLNRATFFLSLLTILINLIFHQGWSGLPVPGFTVGEDPYAPYQEISETGTAQYHIFLPVLKQRAPFPSIFGVEIVSDKSGIGFDKMVSAGAYWVRRSAISWEEVEPVKGQRDWRVLANLEQELARAATQGAQMILIVRNTPAWAQKYPGSSCGPIKPDELASFASFMHELVARYSTAPYKVKYWEILNEPDAPVSNNPAPYGCWGEVSDRYYGGGYYAEMLKLVYPQVKAAQPEAQVLVGGLLLDCDPVNPPKHPAASGQTKDCSSSKFLEGILTNGGSGYFDGVSFHAYDYYQGALGQFGNDNWNSAWNSSGPSLIAKTAYLRKLLATYKVQDKYLINTEVALLCGAGCDQVYEITKAYQLVQAYVVASTLDLRANIWYDAYGVWRNSGLLYPDGSPRPAYHAYRFASRAIGGAQFLREISTTGIKGYEFKKNDRRIWVLWSLDGGTHHFTLPGTPLSAFDSLGNNLEPGAAIQVTINPTYLEWSP